MNDIEVSLTQTDTFNTEVYDVNYLPDYVKAEKERRANEVIRISNEETRQENESSRVNAESLRVSAEEGRVSAEGLRVTAEEGRVDAETLRVSAEEGRVEAENARVLAEEAREATINSLATVATTGSYSDLIDEPTKVSDFTNDSGFVDKDVNNLTYYTLATNTGSTIDLSINSSTYVVTLALKNAAGTTISTDTIDLPLESVVVSGRYDNATQKVILTLQNGSEIAFSVADLVSGLQSEITIDNKLSADLVDDTSTTNKFVTASNKTTWNAKYDKPSGGIPKTDLDSSVQTSLGKADTALQSHQDISGKEDKTNKVTSLSNTSTDTQYPSAKCVYDSQEAQNTQINDNQNMINLITNLLPSDTEEGTNISIDGTAEYPFNKLDLKGNTSQTGTPTPSSPIPVNVVSGDNSICICNKNLAILKDYLVPTTPQGISFTYNNDGSISYSGTLASNTYTTFASGINNSLPLGNYVLSINKTVSYRVNVNVFYDDNTENNFFIIPGNTSLGFEIGKKVVRYSIGFTNMTIGTTYNDTLKIQLEKGTSATSFVKSESEIYHIDLAPNLYDKSKESIGYINNSGTITSSNYTKSSDYIEVEANKQYTIAWDYNVLSATGTREMAYYNTSKTFINRVTGISSTRRHYTFTPSQNGYIRFDYDKNCFNVQCYKNESSIELCKIGNYQDYIFHNIPTNPHYDNTLVEGGWYKYGVIKKIILNGTEDWQLATNDTTTSRFYFSALIINSGDGNDENVYILSKQLLGVSFKSIYANTNLEYVISNYNQTGSTATKRIVVRVPNSVATTKTTLKTWLESNNVETYYPESNATTEQITYQPLINQLNAIENAMSKKGQTNISQVNNDLPFIINAEAILSLQNVLDRVTLLES